MKERPIWQTLLIGAVPLLGFWLYGLTDLDEGFYGAVTREMLRTGNFLVPLYNGEPWFEKPILSYWLAMPVVVLIPNEFGARLPSFLCTIATLWVIARFARTHFGPTAGMVAPLVYSGSLLVVGIGRMMMTDAPFVLALTLCLTFFYDSLVFKRPSLKVWAAFWLGVSALAKGPAGPAFFVLTAALTAGLIPALRPSFRGGWLLGSAVFLGVVSTWYVPAAIIEGQTFISDFLIKQNLGRFSGGDIAHTVPWYMHPIYYPIVCALALLPWLLFVRKKAPLIETGPMMGDQAAAKKYLWIWAWVVVGFFSISGSKLPHYVLPAIVPLATLLALRLLDQQAEPTKWTRVALVWNIALCLIANAVFISNYRSMYAEVQGYAKKAAAENEPLVIYSVGRAAGAADVITTELQQTSHPSLLFYYAKPALLTDKAENVREYAPSGYVIVRSKDVQSLTTDMSENGFTLQLSEADLGKKFSLIPYASEQ